MRVTANGAPRPARSRLPLHVYFGEHRVGLFAGRTRIASANQRRLDQAYSNGRDERRSVISLPTMATPR